MREEGDQGKETWANYQMHVCYMIILSGLFQKLETWLLQLPVFKRFPVEYTASSLSINTFG